MKNGLRVISLFDGMGCLYMALIEAGFKINEYYASEIEKKPIEFTTKNIPCINHLGDITNWKNWDINWSEINFIGAGSPCQGFSFAGKQLNFDDERSKLFFVFIEILNHTKKLNPDVKFLLENVNMKKEYLRIISEYLGVFPARINSNLVAAQNRDRFYWTNIRTKETGLFNELWSDIPQPEDQGILLKDILQPESEIDEKYYIKSSNYDIKGLDLNSKAPKQRSSTGRCLDNKHNYQIIPVLNHNNTLQKKESKSNCIDANYHKGVDNHGQRTIICVSMVGRRIDKNGIRKDQDKSIPAIQRLEPKTDNKTFCLTSVQKDNLILIGGIKNQEIKAGKTKDFAQGARIYSIEGKATTGNSGGGGQGGKTGLYIQDYKLRRLTPTECARLQTIPDWVNFEGFSDTAIYKMLGNGWTVEVIKHIVSFLKT